MTNNRSPLDVWQKQWQLYASNSIYHLNLGVINQIFLLFKNEIKKKNILELGAGSGGDILYLAKAGAACSALDFSPESIAIIEKRAASENLKVRSYCADCLKTGIPNNSFDLVYSVGLVEHFTDPLSVLREQARMLRPGGYLIVDVPQKFNLYTLVKKIRMATGTFPFGWETEYSAFKLKKMARILNLSFVRAYGRDSAFTLKVPDRLKPLYKNIFSVIEKSPLAPYVCLNLGVIYQKPKKYAQKNT
ncbi:MAG TPA: class I SAM-dependent methyltransferase [Patescibacteria group bacterium]